MSALSNARLLVRRLPIASSWLVLLAGCGQNAAPVSYSYVPDAANVRFNDEAQTNNEPKVPLQDLSFVDLKGQAVPLKNYLGDKNLVLVVTRGHTTGLDRLCPYCSTQTSRLISQYDEITKRNAEVVVVFPVRWGKQEPQFESFQQAAKTSIKPDPGTAPFPLLLDLELGAVRNLEIEKDLAKPATYILDRKGQVRFAYVGETMVDRPSIEAILKQLDDLKDDKQPSARQAGQKSN